MTAAIVAASAPEAILTIAPPISNSIAPLLDFFLGPEVAAIAAGATLPPTSPGADPDLPGQAGVRFIGWDVLEANDLGPLIAESGAAFAQAYYEARRGRG